MREGRLNSRLYIGLDAGTSLTKAAIFDLDGRELAVAEKPTAVERPRPGWSEIDPGEAGPRLSRSSPASCATAASTPA